MIEQIMSTQVGMLGFGGFVLVVLVGFFLLAWIKREIKEDDGTQTK
jgi:hypothetical protein